MKVRELIVVILIVAVILAIFLPGVQSAREAARRTTCANNLKQIGLGIHNYHDTIKCLPPGSTGKNASPRIGWQVRILPYTESSPIYAGLNMKLADMPSSPLESPLLNKAGSIYEFPHRQVAQWQVPYTMCPDDLNQSEVNDFAQSSYTGNLGSQKTISGTTTCNPFFAEGLNFQSVRGKANFGDTDQTDEVSGIFSRQLFAKLTLDDIVDGQSNTFLAGEILGNCHPNDRGWWDVNGAGNAHASTSVPLNTMTTCVSSETIAKQHRYFIPKCFELTNTNLSWGFRSMHPFGANFLRADCSVTFINDDINYITYQRLGGRADSIPVPSVMEATESN